MDLGLRERPLASSSEAPRPGVGGGPQWYKDAVIYQLHVKAFQDTHGNGIGDFPGLIQRLDYIQSLGSTAIWLLPFYPSPLRDDGYDISDYRRINPSYGTMRDFRRFVREAHRRGLRIITELVINHTSDQHPWFQRARRAKPGSSARDFYVWSDSDGHYAGTRIIFIDTEKSNWAWDPVAKAYYWHRFYSHQPDLNFDNPRVLREIIKVMRFWLDTGVDGLRLDAIPYLVERDGTNNENLPETHQVLKQIRAELDACYENRMLLAEANQWPEDTAPYFGEGDECHMAFHFPLMPRMYMGVAQEDRHPITDIIRQMPDIPDACQWAIFLRNHDELTLEMVTTEERDYLWRTYAGDTRARLNLGIRRRLAPLMQNDRAKIELMNGLILSMPGTPILYYGDEIGMGDNYFLGDRDGVRTPMQWTADRNGGFSRANPQEIYLPPIMDPLYGYQAINVEAQDRDPSSLLNWMRRTLAVRARYQAFGRGSIRFFYPKNRKILAYIREYGGERILCVANLARSAQAVELDLSAYRGAVPVEMIGRAHFPPVGDLPYLLTLAGYGFYWFSLENEAGAPEWHEAMPETLPEFVTLTASGGSIRDVLVGRELRQLERDILPSFLPLQRWFAGKQDRIDAVSIFPLTAMDRADRVIAVAVVTVDGAVNRYFLPLVIRWGEENLRPGAPFLSRTLARVRKGPRLGALVDGVFDDDFAIELMSAIRSGVDVSLPEGGLKFDTTEALRGTPKPETVRRVQAEQSNVSVIINEAAMLKIYRRLQSGIQPDAEVGRFLTEVAGFTGTPRYLGAATLIVPDGTVTTLATAFAFVPNQGDAWSGLLEALTHDLEVSAITSDPRTEPFVYPLDIAEALGRRTAEMHAAFAHPTDDAAFQTIPLRATDLAAWSREVAREAHRMVTRLRQQARTMPPEVESEVSKLVAARSELFARIEAIGSLSPSGGLSRIHGDYHLGQVLICHNDVVIVDFEGEPQRSLDERRKKSSPLRDVAGMLRSFDYLAWAALERRNAMAGSVTEVERRRAMLWRDQATRDFLGAYERGMEGISSAPEEIGTSETLRTFFTIQKAIYEVGYELANRPSWLPIPVRGILHLLGRQSHSS